MIKVNHAFKFGLLSLLITCVMPAFAQTQPRITLLDFIYQGPAEYYRNSLLPVIADKDAPTTNKNAAAQPAPPDIILKPEDLQRIVVLLKGILLRQGSYRLIPPLKTINHNPTTIAAVNKAIDNQDFPESDYILYGLINYANATMLTTSNAATKTKTGILNLDLVGEFSLINTATKKVDVYFTVMGKANDTNTVNISSDSVPLNKFKVINNASNSLANAIAQELEIQLTPALIQQRINDGELKPKADPNAITIK